MQPSIRSVLIPFCLFLTLAPVAGTAQSAEFRHGESLDLRGEADDRLFAAGGRVNADVRARDNVYLAGGNVVFSGAARETVHAAAGELTIERAQIRDLVAAGGSVKVQRTRIQDDLIGLGGEVRIGPESVVQGSTTLMGSDVILEGQFRGDVQVRANHLTIAPSALIAGNLVHSTSSLRIEPGARIQGRTISQAESAPSGWAGGAVLIASLLFVIGSLLVTPTLASLAPGLMQDGAHRIRAGLWETLGKGLVTLLLAPAAWTLLLVSAVGTPIALTLLPFLVASAILAWCIVVYALGRGLRLRLRRPRTADGAPQGAPLLEASRREAFLWTALGSLLAMLLLGVPFLGALLGFVAYLAGVGALYETFRARITSRSRAPESGATGSGAPSLPPTQAA